MKSEQEVKQIIIEELKNNPGQKKSWLGVDIAKKCHVTIDTPLIAIDQLIKDGIIEESRRTPGWGTGGNKLYLI